MGKATLVVMAAGIGSRFGGGIKQLEPIGPNGELIIDYSVYDAVNAGFDKVVFVIRKDLEQDFKEIIGDRVEQKVEVEYAYQEIEDVPEKYQAKSRIRKKPWGTGQAVLVCRDLVHEPFLVINADDYYGKAAYERAFETLIKPENRKNPNRICMVGFVLEKTLSENGTVTRGVCKEDQEGMLLEVIETYEISKAGDTASAVQKGKAVEIPLNTPVSMNMWGLNPEFFDILAKGFVEFLEQWDEDSLKSEYLLPSLVGELLEKQQIEVEVLHSAEQWFGVTYKEDKEAVVKALRKLLEKGLYPYHLY
ncbi:MAG: nucleotidyltransferase family protein [Lachnospiraceae bacterium]